MSFNIKEPFTLKCDWILSKCNEEVVSIPQEIVANLRNYHITGVEFLYHNYKKGLKGSILNEENDMNFPLQITAFLSAVFRKGCVLIICPDSHIIQWHYNLVKRGKFESVQINKAEMEFRKDRLIQIFGFSHLKEIYLEYEYFSVIVGNFDEIASKMIFKRKLSGNFNIGLTHRNFYLSPDQRLKWLMLNWSNPGCVEKLGNFYEIDQDNFQNLRDNYRFWWLRLTWQFSKSFLKPTETEINEYKKCLSEWSKRHNFDLDKIEKGQKRKLIVETISHKKTKEIVEKTENLKNGQSTYVKDNKNEILMSKEESDLKGNSTSFQNENSENGTPKSKEKSLNYVQLPSMDENPILTSIIKNFEMSPEPSQHFSCTDFSLKDNSFFETSRNVILSIIDGEDQPCTSKSLFKNDSDQFLIGLASCSRQNEYRNSNISDIEKILQETDELLRN